MAHLMNWPGQKKLSLESVHVTPNGNLQVACWGMCPGLEFIATDDLDWQFDIASGTFREEEKAKYTLGTPLSAAQCKVTDIPCKVPNTVVKQFQFKESGQYRIVLRMGGGLWDWMRVYVKNNVPEVITDKEITDGALNVEILWAVPQGYGINYLPHATTVAGILLQQHGLKLNLSPSPAYNSGRILSGFESGIVCTYGQDGNLNKVADALKTSPHYRKDALMVIMANARETKDPGYDKNRLAGVTVSQYTQVKPFVVLNLNVAAVDGSTLLHEMGHAAGFCDHESPGSHFMSYGALRNEVTKGHVRNFRNSFFWSSN